jgi:hypothetical protein
MFDCEVKRRCRECKRKDVPMFGDFGNSASLAPREGTPRPNQTSVLREHPQNTGRVPPQR